MVAWHVSVQLAGMLARLGANVTRPLHPTPPMHPRSAPGSTPVQYGGRAGERLELPGVQQQVVLARLLKQLPPHHDALLLRRGDGKMGSGWVSEQVSGCGCVGNAHANNDTGQT